MIPQTLWRIWLDEPVPDKYEEFWQHAKELHPDWDLRTLQDSSELTWMRPEMKKIFQLAPTHAGRSDVLRYEVLYQFGGVYVDCDVEFLRPFDDLLNGPTFAGWEDGNLICPTVMGSEAQSDPFAALTEALPTWFYRNPGGPPNQTTGPHLLTHVWRFRENVRLLPPVAFYPVHWSRKRDLTGVYPEESYCVHHWDARWLPNGPPQR